MSENAGVCALVHAPVRVCMCMRLASAAAVLRVRLPASARWRTGGLGVPERPAARQDVREKAVVPVPRHLQDKHYAGAKRLGHGQGYAYAHDAPDAIAKQDYLGVERTYYQPTSRGLERDLGERLAEIRRRLKEAHAPPEQPPGSATH